MPFMVHILTFFSDLSATEMEARMQLLYFLKAQMKELSVDVEAFDPPYFLQTSIMTLRKKNETGRSSFKYFLLFQWNSTH
jgi:hypothetical protein